MPLELNRSLANHTSWFAFCTSVQRRTSPEARQGTEQWTRCEKVKKATQTNVNHDFAVTDHEPQITNFSKVLELVQTVSIPDLFEVNKSKGLLLQLSS